MFLVVSLFDPASKQVISENKCQFSNLTSKQKTALVVDIFMIALLVVIIVLVIVSNQGVNLGSSIGAIGGGFSAQGTNLSSSVGLISSGFPIGL